MTAPRSATVTLPSTTAEAGTLPSLTAVIPTRNRCPHGTADAHLNPLTWCLQSLFDQRGSGLRRIVVVDDASTDHTEAVVSHLAYGAPVEVTYQRNPSRQGPCRARNLGLRAAGTTQVFFTDDDCVFADPRALAVTQHTHRILGADAAHRVGGLHLPVFLRSDDYRSVISATRIGRIHAAAGQVHANFGCFPAEYTDLRTRTDLAVALPSDFLQEVFLIDTAVLTGVGGFPDTGFDAVHHEGVFLTLRLAPLGLAHAYLAHPHTGVIHLRYGASHTPSAPPASYPGLKVGQRQVPFAVMLAESAIDRPDTGGRAGLLDVVHDLIAGRYTQLLHLDPAGGQAWEQLSYDAFVTGTDPHGLLRIPPIELGTDARVELWRAALRHGKDLYDRRPTSRVPAGSDRA